MIIGGFKKNSFIDYPGKIASIVYTQGCNLRCFYCHNPELVPVKNEFPGFPEEEVFNYLNQRRGKIQGLVISGGEPTLQPDLKRFIAQAKNLDLLLKLDTNGTNPNILAELIAEKHLDYVAMDIKAPLDTQSYKAIVGEHFFDSMMDKVKESISILLKSDIDVEFRTTSGKGFLELDDLKKIIDSIGNTALFSVQNYSDEKTLATDTIECKAFSEGELLEIKKGLSDLHKRVEVR